MTNYEQQAKDFCKKHGVKVNFRWIANEPNPLWNESQIRPHYKVTIKTERGQMTVDFWDSVYSMTHDEKPTEYDIFSCMEKYEVYDFDEWCAEYGYDSRRAERLWRLCRRQWESVQRVFYKDQIAELREIN